MIEEQANPYNINVEDMAKVGLHFGHKTSKVHPKMGPYLYGVRNGIYLIDLTKTKEKMEEALKIIEKMVGEGKSLLVVGTKVQFKKITKDFAEECGLFYVEERWIGGTFTNFEVIKKRINHFKGIQERKDKGELEKYTKKEQGQMNAALSDFTRKFGGIKDMEKIPDFILVLSLTKENLATKEAKEKGVTVIGITDIDSDPTLADYPIPASDDSAVGIHYILDKIKEVILKAKDKARINQQEAERQEKKGE